MNVDYQNIINLIIQLGVLVFPLALVFCVVEKLIDIFLTFVSGKRVKL